MRSVSVINLITEDSIEHNILHLLGRKQALADGVLDGCGDLATLRMPSGRAAFIERMSAPVHYPITAVCCSALMRRRGADKPDRLEMAKTSRTFASGDVEHVSAVPTFGQ
jgi:hypothetical protein